MIGGSTRSIAAVQSCLRDSAQLSTLPKWCRGELSTAADLIDELQSDLAAAIARAEALGAKLAAMGQDAREIYAQIPGLPVTPETCDAATDVLTRFCIDFNDAIAAQQAEGESHE